jgi:hypothetical protein
MIHIEEARGNPSVTVYARASNRIFHYASVAPTEASRINWSYNEKRSGTRQSLYIMSLEVVSKKFSLYFSGSCIPTNESLFIFENVNKR